MLNKSGVLGGGEGGGLLGKILGGAGVSGFGVAYLGLSIGTRLLKSAFDDLRKSVVDASRLFYEARRYRMTGGRLKEMETFGTALGLSGSETQQMLQRLMYPTKGGLGGRNVALLGQISGQPDVVKYISQFTNENKNFWTRFSRNARDAHVVWTAFTYQFETFMAKLADTFLPTLTQLLNGFTKLSNIPNIGLLLNATGRTAITGGGMFGFMSNLMKAGLDQINAKGHNLFADNPPEHFSAFRWNQLPRSSFERMGFVIGRGSSVENNIERIATGTYQMIGILKQIASGNPLGAVMKAMHNMP